MDNPTESNAPAAPVAEPTTTAPVATAAPVEPTATAPVAAPVTTAEPVAPVATAEETDEYSWLPPKFKLDGKPDFQKLATSYTALEKKISAKAGVAPESTDDYVYEPKHYQSSEEETTAFKETAKKLNLSAAQYAGLSEFYDQAMERTADSPAKTKAYLEEHWGTDFERNTQLAIRAFDAYAPSHIPIEAIGNNPFVIDLLARFGAELGEDAVPSARTTNARMTRDDVKALMAKPEYKKPGKEGDALRSEVETWYAKNVKE